MALVDLTPADLDLSVVAGNTITVRITFDISLTGYTAWKAQARPQPSGAPIDFTIDASQQASRIITIQLTAALSAQLKTGWRWDLRVSDPSGAIVTLFAGKFFEVVDPITQ